MTETAIVDDRNPEQRVLDDIDALVDEQMRQERSGYDHNINQQRCPHCGDDRHTLAITERMREMRSKFRSTISYYEDDPQVSQDLVDELNSYRYDQDDSPIVCPGSDFIGPILPPTPNESRVRIWDADWNCIYDSDVDVRNHWDVIRERGDERTNYSIDRRNSERESGRVEAGPYGRYFARDDQYLRDIQTWMNPIIPMPNSVQSVSVEGYTRVGQLETRRDLPFVVNVNEGASTALTEFRTAFLNESTTAETLPQRALPRPSTTPPMWAIDPTRQRRNRRRP